MSRVKKVPKPPAALIKKAKKYHVKVTKKVGRKRVYKRVSLIKKQIKKAMRKVRKGRKVRKVRKSRTRYNVEGSGCNKLKKRVCQSSPNCAYTKRGCRRRPGVKGGLVFEGPSLPGFGGRRYSRSHFGLYNPFAGMRNIFARQEIPTWDPPEDYQEPTYDNDLDLIKNALVNKYSFMMRTINNSPYKQTIKLLTKAVLYMLQKIVSKTNPNFKSSFNPEFEKFSEDDYVNAVDYLLKNNNPQFLKQWNILFDSLGYYANRDPKFILKYSPDGFWMHLSDIFTLAKTNK
jgi:hypothetical protein